METWPWKWIGLGVGLLLLLVVISWTAYGWRQSGEAANWHSIAGFWLGAVAFGITIVALIQTQHAVASTQQQINVALGRVKREVRRADCEALRDLIERLTSFAEHGDWAQVHVHARQCSRFAERLSLADGFTEEEGRTLAGKADDLRTFARYVRRQLAANEAVLFDDAYSEALAVLDTLLDKAAAKSFWEPMELGNVNTY